MMRILAFTDSHGSTAAIRKIKAKAGKADIILCGGDLTLFEDKLVYFVGELSKTGKTVLAVHGNHEGEDAFGRAAAGFENVHFIHKKVFRVGDVVFMGFGGGGFSQVDKGIEGFARRFRKSTKGLKVVFVTHAPPYGTRLDLVAGRHCGNKTARQFIEKIKPALVVCGHLHENSGKKDKIKKTEIINPGPEGRILTV